MESLDRKLVLHQNKGKCYSEIDYFVVGKDKDRDSGLAVGMTTKLGWVSANVIPNLI